ncbi:unnamed protein product [Musa acuminata subsp. malaccensis]|uniref:(wild Malaysian banana) hypothetical protein n=1 Tax=Musa acuminata subsp. malaccensis TaxID=214687 RepID=A0A804J0X8_MUSAM|nr:PREDICTED: protein SMAX1-LIKE 4-like [Musa acuminata subsp. malaccensis]CAG1837527.1 unnamed protein product [Musa acuminata subsp. malaccensis]
MRTGACTLQQALTAEAASVLKHSLSLARRRGHAQVTPLHVATTLLSCSSSSNLLRRACLKSQPHCPASHPLRCRALELCFNVALNRLPTTPPPASHPSLSNALVAALKRAQAHQRRGCMELQQQQQQLLLAVKIELEQLIISILDDPSVSRVMREAGFSSTSVKNSLEGETSSVLSRSSPFLLESHKDVIDHRSPLFTLSSQQSSHHHHDSSAVLEVMLGKQGRRTNTVLVGDSVSLAEGVVAELMAKVGRGEVPDELKAAHFIKLHLSYVHLRLMSRSDVDLKLSDLRRKIDHLASERTGGGVIIYAGDLRWAVDEETRDGCRFKPVEHMVAELGRLLSEFRSSIGNGGGGTVNTKLWLLATASYQTYMRCQVRQPSLETRWALQAVVVPSGGLGLSLQAPSGLHTGLPELFEHPSPLLGSKVLSSREDEKLICCGECISNFEKEASVHRSVNKDTNCGSTQLPFWLQRQSPDNHKDALLELKRKWNSLCRNLHHIRRSQTRLHPSSILNQSSIGKNLSCSSSYPWWPNSNQSESSMQTTPELDGGLPFDMIDSRNGTGNWQEREESKPSFPEVSLHCLRSAGNLDVGVTLSLGGAVVSDSATSNKQKEMMTDHRELTRKLLENMPWQSEIVPSMVEALTSSENKGVRLLLQGNDCVSKRRLARVMVEHFGGSEERFIHIDMRRRASKCSSCGEILEEALEKESKLVVFMEDIDRADTSFVTSLVDVLKMGAFETSSGQEVCLTETTFILTTSSSAGIGDANDVIKMKLQAEVPSTNKDLRRKAETEQQNKPKRPRTGDCTLDLNLLAEGEDEEAVPSDLTNETDCGNSRLPSELLELITARLAMDADLERLRPASENLVSKLRRAFDEVRSGVGGEIGELLIDGAAVAELMAAAGSFLEGIFERWVREVFQTCLRRVERGGNVRLRAEGKVGNVGEFGFMSSLLPKWMDVD